MGVVGDSPGEPWLGVVDEDGVAGEREAAVSGVVPTGNPGHSPQYLLQPALQHSQLLLSSVLKETDGRPAFCESRHLDTAAVRPAATTQFGLP